MSLYYAAVDLHSNQSVLVLIDEKDQQEWKGRLDNDLELVLIALAPYRDQLAAVAVESTCNCYWLVDGLMDAGYEIELVNPEAVKKYEGLKHQDDISDAYWQAHLLRLGILPTGYIYPRQRRGLRDLARKRLRLVSQQTAHILSLESLYNRCLSQRSPTCLLTYMSLNYMPVETCNFRSSPLRRALVIAADDLSWSEPNECCPSCLEHQLIYSLLAFDRLQAKKGRCPVMENLPALFHVSIIAGNDPLKDTGYSSTTTS